MFWQSRPFLRILPLYVAGIIAAHELLPENYPALPVFYLLSAIFILSIVLVYFFRPAYRYRWISTFFLYLGLFLAGITLTLQKTARYRLSIPAKRTFWSGSICSDPILKKQTIRFVFKGKPVTPENIRQPPVKLLVFLKGNSIPDSLQEDARITFYGSPQPVSAPQNPGEFDYRQYLANQQIGYTVFIDSHSWRVVGSPVSHSLSGRFARWRKKLLHILDQQKLNKTEKSIAAAILLGKQEMIQPEIYQNFTAAGAVHILCVSGLHVGIIFLIFHFLLRFLVRLKNGENIRRAILILIIWGYALLTGLSPSVTRAATMLSLFIFAEMLGRDYDRFNLLAASAFLLLLFNPPMLYNVGFQLSYAAVGGIFLFYFPLYRAVYFRHRLPQIFWAVLAVSLSAQAGAFAIAAHYFHQFPVYFLLTNLTVFLLSYFIIIFGLALLLFSPVPFLSKIFALLLAQSIDILVHIVHFVASLPHAVMVDIYFPWIIVFGVFALLFMVYFLLKHKNLHLLLPMLALMLLLESIHTGFHYQQWKQQKLIVYAIPRHTAIDLIAGKQHITLIDTGLLNHPEKTAYFLENERIALELKRNDFPLNGKDMLTRFAFYQSGFGQIGKIRFFVSLPHQKYYPALQHKIKVNYLICRAPWKTSLHEIEKSISFQRVILDKSLRKWEKSKITHQLKELKISYIDTQKTGAFIKSITQK
ncbi:ComEC family competence protein [Candidatus Sulfidibacterium hydrothermale]|uniref:ComEC/Rec2 family competence protein n=1 Tax=Candidatus Sulfidibacterium hydrothermale TaxID=2875962 RepID=UPI001F0A4725|nr:ComEC/Rec2 family competence protein [Candidatus Sulfidibacterium hydrothermale]UBM61170.1 ComEC family competence protein [Candidatus Sulfidibacterium hydrothermale]